MTLLVQVREDSDPDQVSGVDTPRNAFQISTKGGMHRIARQLHVGHEGKEAIRCANELLATE